ncbi:MAG TPA: M23 family metallopeptidase, partial [Acidimicrobiales bacterium]
PAPEAAVPPPDWSPPSSTAALDDALADLDACGPMRVPGSVPGRFPVAGAATYINDWHFPRFVPSFHLHQGTDVFADRGTPVRSPADGTVRISNGPVGGLAVYVTDATGTYYYLAHLDGTVRGLATGQRVRTGDVVGFVGDSGNAKGGETHLHFEVHPNGGAAVNPKPILDGWLAEAAGQATDLASSCDAARSAITLVADVAALDGPARRRAPEADPAATPARVVSTTTPSVVLGAVTGEVAAAPIADIGAGSDRPVDTGLVLSGIAVLLAAFHQRRSRAAVRRRAAG